jgi:hypothetical protein
MEEKDKLDQITRRIIGAAIEVHKALGPGLLEAAYEVCLAFELHQMGLLSPIDDAQLLSYLRLSHKRVALLLNFHVRVLKDGLKRIVNEFPDSATSAVS